MTTYLHSLAVIVPAALVEQIRPLFAEWEASEPQAALGCRLSASGQEPATHFGAHTVITEEVRAGLSALWHDGDLPAEVAYLIVPNAPAGRVFATNVAGCRAGVGANFVSLRSALGLQPIRPASMRA